MAEHSQAHPDTIDEAVKIMRVLADPTRLRLLGLLQGGERNVTALCEQLDLAQPTVSHHLALLRTSTLVTNRRDGKQVFYALNDQTVTSLEGDGGLTVKMGPVELRFCDPTQHCEPANVTPTAVDTDPDKPVN